MMKIRTKGPDETRALGSKIGKLLKAGDTVALYGELGAGKTTIAKVFAKLATKYSMNFIVDVLGLIYYFLQ